MNQPDRYSRCDGRWRPSQTNFKNAWAATMPHNPTPLPKRPHPSNLYSLMRKSTLTTTYDVSNIALPVHSTPDQTLTARRFVLAEGSAKAQYTPDTKLENAGSFMMLQEDHTMGNLLRMQLHADRHVTFAGYRIPHPLEPKLVVRVQTNGVKTPVQAVEHALEDLRSEVPCLQCELCGVGACARDGLGRRGGGGQSQTFQSLSDWADLGIATAACLWPTNHHKPEVEPLDQCSLHRICHD
jgi:DNA-directed RNA polymerase II subunit RPB11